MPPDEERRIEEHVDVSDSTEAVVTRRVLIPTNFTNLDLKVNYFMPRFKKVNRGEEIEWVNEDITSHHLDFYDLSSDNPILLFDSNEIFPNRSFKKKFDFNLIRIDYLCRLHENEVGAVIIYQIPDDEMTNAQRLRFLSRAFHIEPPSVLDDLRGE